MKQENYKEPIMEIVFLEAEDIVCNSGDNDTVFQPDEDSVMQTFE